MVNTLYDKAQKLYNNGKNIQDTLYDSIVIEAMLENSGDMAKVMEEYWKAIGYFDVNSYRKVMTHIYNVIRKEKPEMFESYIVKFRAIGRYVQFRNEFTTKCLEFIKSGDGDDLVKSIDRKRSEQHNYIIELFNDLNELANQLGVSRPYIHDKKYFDKTNINDRNAVAQILKVQEPLSETLEILCAKGEIVINM